MDARSQQRGDAASPSGTAHGLLYLTNSINSTHGTLRGVGTGALQTCTQVVFLCRIGSEVYRGEKGIGESQKTISGVGGVALGGQSVAEQFELSHRQLLRKI